MTRDEHYAVNMTAFRQLKPAIDAYPVKQFVAIAGGRIVADDADFDALRAKLNTLGIDPMESLIDRSGDRLPSVGTFRGALTPSATGGAVWNTGTLTEDH